jgi:hypothetical protein
MAFQKAANILATVDPVQASRWIELYLGQDYAQTAPVVIGRRWLEVDPPAARNWLASVGRGEANDGAQASAQRARTSEAPEDVEARVRTITEAGAGGAAIAEMISRHADEPAEAIFWAQQISDPADRFRTIVRLARAWHRSDPAATERWLEQSELPSGVRNAILNPPTAQRRSVSKAAEAGPGPSN